MEQNNLANNPFAMLFNSTDDAKLFKSQSDAAVPELATGGSDPSKEMSVKTQLEIDSFLENIFLITTNNVRHGDRPLHCVFLEDFKSLNAGQDWLDVSMIEQAVFERLTMDNLAASVVCTSDSEGTAASRSVAAEPDAVKYLYQCYKRSVELIRRPQFRNISKECVDRCSEVIAQNGRIAFQLMTAVFPNTRPCYQFVEIMLESSVEGDLEVASRFFELIAAQIAANPDEGSLAQTLQPSLDDVKSRLRLDYLLEDPMLYRIIEFVMFFTRSSALAEVLITHSTPSDLANSRAYEDTLLGRLLSASCVPPTDIGPFLYFNEPSRLTKPEVDLAEQRIQQMLARLTDAMHQLVLRLLKLGGESRHLTLEWVANCLHANKGRAKLWNNQMMPMQLTTVFCSDGFFLNLSSVLVRLCQPLSEPCSAKLLKLQPTYCQATAGTRDQRLARNVHMQDLAKETCLVPAPAGTEPQLEASYSFLTEVFFLAHDCLHIGFEVASDRFTRINQMLHRIQSIYQDIGRQGGEQSEVGLRIKDQMEKGMSVFLTLKAAMTENTYIEMTSRFLVATATYCTQLATVPSTTDGFILPSYPLSPDSVSPQLCFLPEFLVDNITGFLLFLRRFKDSAYEFMGEHLDHLMTFVLIFMANSDRLRNPHLRAQMAELLEALMPPREVSTQLLAPPSYYRDRLFSQHPLVAVLSEALLTVFVSIEMTGQGVSFEQKFNYRRPMYAVLKYIWERDVHRTAMQRLAEDALRNIDNQPLFLRFINLLINDATYLLDEALSHMAQIKEKQEERERGDWAQLAPQQRQEVEMNYRHISMIARFHNIMGNETILSLALITQHIHDIFCHPILVERIAAMLNYFLLHLVGPKKKNLKVKDFGEFDFKPQELVSHISQIYVNLADREEFCRAVSQDGRSYSQQLFGQAVAVLQKIHWPMEKIVRFEQCAEVIKRLAEREKAAEEQLTDVPDDFLDPIMGTLMTDPVLLPSGNIVDRATIARHILSDQSDPFTRQPLKMDMVKPATELRDRINEWRNSRTGSQP